MVKEDWASGKLLEHTNKCDKNSSRFEFKVPDKNELGILVVCSIELALLLPSFVNERLLFRCHNMSHVMRKPVLAICEKQRF